MRPYKLLAKWFLGILSLLLLINLAVLWLLYHYLVEEALDEAVNGQTELIQRITSAGESQLAAVERDITYLANQRLLAEFLARTDDVSRQHLEQEYIAFASAKHVFAQVRLLGPKGQELVRVDHSESGTFAVSRQGLQNKAHRDYVQLTLLEKPGTICISTFDLNQEEGKIQEPLTPMIRFTTPVSGPAGEMAGLLVLNYNGNQLIDRIRAKDHGEAPLERMLVNQDGYFLLSGSTGDEWGFLLPGREDRIFANRFPGWQEIQNAGSGVIKRGDDLLIFSTLIPGRQLEDSRAGHIKCQDRYWKVIFHGRISDLLGRERFIFYLAIFAFTLGSIFVSVLFVRSRYKLHRKREDEVRHLSLIKVINEELQAKNRQLSESNRQLGEANANQTRLFSIISHDIKNPLVALINFPELVLMQAERLSREEILKIMEQIKTSADRLHDLIENLLEWSRLQLTGRPSRKERIDLSASVDMAMDLAASAASAKQITMIRCLECDTAFGNEREIATILRNLLGNAIKFTPQLGRVNVASIQDGDFVLLSVSDNGVGMAPDDLENLFRSSVSVRSSGTEGETGTGLGLSVCKKLAEKNGGDLWLESVQDKGTTSFLRIPLSEA
jgi:signal transduction histidine kinase